MLRLRVVVVSYCWFGLNGALEMTDRGWGGGSSALRNSVRPDRE